MRPQADIDASIRDDDTLNKIAKGGSVSSDFAFAVRNARQVCAEADLNLTFDEHGNAGLTEFQMHKMARHTREDVSATLMLQVSIMRRLDRNRNFMWVIIALLVYIASQLN